MNGMTVQQRLDDICKRQGMSEEIVRRVLQAEKASVLDSLKRGEKATLIGRCVIRPELRSKVDVGGDVRDYIKASASVAYTLQNELQNCSEFEKSQESENQIPEGIRITQISQLL